MKQTIRGSMEKANSNRREVLATTPDVRAIATRRRLASALRELLLEHADEVSVVEIANRAEVGRSTFYTHFATVEDLAVFVVDEILAALAPLDVQRRTRRDLSRAEITRLGLGELIDNFSTEREVLIFAAHSTSAVAVRERFVRDLAASMEQTMLAEMPDLDDTALTLSTEFVAAGVIHVALAWLTEPGTATRQQVIDILFGILPAWLTTDPE